MEKSYFYKCGLTEIDAKDVQEGDYIYSVKKEMFFKIIELKKDWMVARLAPNDFKVFLNIYNEEPVEEEIEDFCLLFSFSDSNEIKLYRRSKVNTDESQLIKQVLDKCKMVELVMTKNWIDKIFFKHNFSLLDSIKEKSIAHIFQDNKV